MNEFEKRVSEALAAIPHGAQCPAQPQEYPVDAAELVTITMTMGICECDREERIAQRVAAAINAANKYPARDWALAALRGVTKV